MLAKNIKKLRIKNKLSQEEFAKKEVEQFYIKSLTLSSFLKKFPFSKKG